jgi:hypothetical protein
MKYVVTVEAPGTMEADIEVEAPSREEAEAMALKKARDGDMDVWWNARGVDGDVDYFDAEVYLTETLEDEDL